MVVVTFVVREQTLGLTSFHLKELTTSWLDRHLLLWDWTQNKKPPAQADGL
jgi:hypothetical protein